MNHFIYKIIKHKLLIILYYIIYNKNNQKSCSKVQNVNKHVHVKHEGGDCFFFVIEGDDCLDDY